MKIWANLVNRQDFLLDDVRYLILKDQTPYVLLLFLHDYGVEWDFKI